MTLTPQTAIASYYESECRDFDGPIPPDVALAGASLDPQERPRANGAAGLSGDAPADERTSLLHAASVPVAPLRLHVLHLRAQPQTFLGQRFCKCMWRYRRALGDRRLTALRRAYACALTHCEVTL